jgi:hypothetical protein
MCIANATAQEKNIMLKKKHTDKIMTSIDIATKH